MSGRVYFDHASTTPLSERARAVLLESLDLFGNASSVHHEGQRARAVMEDARSLVAAALGVHDDEIVFTGSGTEADNLAMRGACWAADGRPHLVTTAIEHDAVRRTARWLAGRGHADLTVIAPSSDGVIAAKAVVEALRPDTALVSVMAVNNELGTLQPVEAIGAACRERGVPFHVDAVQALGRIPLRPPEVPADLVTLSAHKVGGPQGVGVLVVRRGLKLQPALTGGEQEFGLRPGTEVHALVAAAARAIADAAHEQPERAARLALLTRRLEQALVAIPGFRLNGARDRRAPGFTNVSFEGVDGTLLLESLDVAGFAVSTGSACTSGSVAPSHVLQAIGLSEEDSRSAIRISLAPQSTEGEIDGFLAVLPSLVELVRRSAPRAAAGPRAGR